ncbi:MULTISPECIES: hypothetical protein [Acidithiobacillus]|jgi:hypothetical protein|uniref:hypothetical protein n=1 Tax=Acidithiobacillus TaxID=119977 RepID=UPI0004E0F7CA|nr:MULTISPECIES: hypothetical protein [Acidithiobacillus]
MKLLIHMDGGLIQGIFADEASDVEVIVADYDVTGTQQTIHTDPDGDQVVLWKEEPVIGTTYAEQMFKLFESVK